MSLEMPDDKNKNKRKKLIFRSWHRGTQEMDLIMGRFADDFLPKCSEADLEVYEELLNEPDPDLYNWVSGKEELPANKHSSVMEQLLTHHENWQK